MKKEVREIITRELSGEINLTDSKALQTWLEQSENNKKEYAKIRDIVALNNALSCEISNKNEVYNKIVSRKNVLRRYMYGISSAAAIVILFIGLFSLRDKTDKSVIKSTVIASNSEVTFISNGNSYSIDSDIDKICVDGAEIQNNSQDKILEFKVNEHSEKVVENTIIVPVGRIYKVILPDGSQVTLNAKSTLSFPSRFEGEYRVVKLDGEALFDVTHNADKQFVVKANKSEVRVYGTVFNMCAYNTDSVDVVSLISGSVVTGNGGVEKKIKPGEQATIESNKQIKVSSFNADEVLSWENMMFFFEDKPLYDIIVTIEHWYGVKFNFMNDNLKNVCAYVKVKRSTSLDELLELIAATNKVRFEFIEKGILIYPNK